MQEKEVEPQSPDAHAEPHHAEFDDVVHVPKGQSKVRFFVLLGLTILVLLIFTVGSELQQSFQSRGSGGNDAVTWNDPTHGPQHVSALTFRQEMIALQDFYRVQGVNTRGVADADATAAMLVNDRLAEDSGIEVTEEELKNAILQGDPRVLPRGFFSKEIYVASCQQAGVTTKAFESSLKRMLRIARYHQMLMAVAAVASPDDIEKTWKTQHQEFAFEYIEVPTASVDAEVAALVPDDAALDAWYLGLPNRLTLFADLVLPAKFSAEVVGYPISGEFQAAGLLAKFPRAADRDVDAEAKVYYEAVRERRFRRELPLEGEGIDEAMRFYQPYEDVAAIAKREAPIYNAMRDWLLDLSKRAESGTAIDPKQEAIDFGLFQQSDEALRTNVEWMALGGLYGPYLTNALAGASPITNLSATVECEAGGFGFGRVKVRQPSSLPPLADVKERVVAEWKKSKRGELAKAKLETVRAGFPTPPPEPPTDKNAAPRKPMPHADAAAFAQAASAAGLTVVRRDFAERTRPKSAAATPKTAADTYFETAFMLYQLEPNEVAAVELDRTAEHAYLVRFDAKRDPETVKITPGEYEQLKMRAEYEAFQRYMISAMTAESLAKRYDLKVKGSTKAPAP